MSSMDIPGNFELVMQSPEFEIEAYPTAKMTLRCAIDCRVGMNSRQIAKFEDCYLLYSFQRWNDTTLSFDTMKSGYCSSKRDQRRTGPVSTANYYVYIKGKYRVRYKICFLFFFGFGGDVIKIGSDSMSM